MACPMEDGFLPRGAARPARMSLFLGSAGWSMFFTGVGPAFGTTCAISIDSTCTTSETLECVVMHTESCT